MAGLRQNIQDGQQLRNDLATASQPAPLVRNGLATVSQQLRNSFKQQLMLDTKKMIANGIKSDAQREKGTPMMRKGYQSRHLRIIGVPSLHFARPCRGTPMMRKAYKHVALRIIGWPSHHFARRRRGTPMMRKTHEHVAHRIIGVPSYASRSK